MIYAVKKWIKFFVSSFLMTLTYIFVLLYNPREFTFESKKTLFIVLIVLKLLSIVFLTSKCMYDETKALLSCDYSLSEIEHTHGIYVYDKIKFNAQNYIVS